MARPLKLQDDLWRFHTPGGFARDSTAVSAALGVLERFGKGNEAVYRHVLTHVAGATGAFFGPGVGTGGFMAIAAKNVFEAAAQSNGAMLIRAFVYSVDLLRERGLDVPDRHSTLAMWAKGKCGFGVVRGTICHFTSIADQLMRPLSADNDVREEPKPPVAPSGTRVEPFLCHASEDKPAVKYWHAQLKADGFYPWLDESSLIGGQRWRAVISQAIGSTCHFILVFLSPTSIAKIGFVQDEIAFARDRVAERPPETIFVIPVRLQPCDVPEQLADLHVIDLFDDDGYDRLTAALLTPGESL